MTPFIGSNFHAFDGDHYLNSPKFRLGQFRRRWLRRIRFEIKSVEPRAKRPMPDADKDEIQAQLLKSLHEHNRRAFRGPLALRLVLSTTEKSPAHSHHIAKNLLDLFGKLRPKLNTRRKNLLYADDSQVQGLSVVCQHGSAEPQIRGTATPLRDLLSDLDLARYATQECDFDDQDFDDLHNAIDDLNDLVRNEVRYRERLGDQTVDLMFKMSRRLAQEQLLGHAATPTDLANMYGAGRVLFPVDRPEMWERLFSTMPLRILLSELPQAKGAATLWRMEIDEKIQDFKARYGWLIDPLIVPVALEVIVKPPPIDRRRGLHDLDNILRNYLIPRIVETLKPVSHHTFTVDEDAMKRAAPDTYATYASFAKPPLSTRAGVARYEAWRLPPAERGATGFVSVALVADVTGPGDIFDQIDDAIERWEESLDDL